jgi:pimeloyl-ACP methyl ester carboxylesterase
MSAEPVGADGPDSAGPGSAGRRWLRVVAGAVLVLVVVVAVVRAGSALVANNPAYPVCLALALAAGGWLLVTGLRPRPAAPTGTLRTGARVLAASAGVGVAAMLFWLMPAVAQPVAIEALAGNDAVRVTDNRSETVYEPVTGPRGGLVLVGGALVDPRAYAVLASRIAAEGYRVVVVKCPFDLDVTCPDSPATWVSDESLRWSVGGHSLGGVVATAYAGRDTSVDGLVLWASYPLEDISDRTGLAVSSIGGSNDGLSTPADIDERMPLLPPDAELVRIEGAIHSFFGDYGLQAGDGVPTVSRAEAQDEIVAATLALLERAAAAQD